jgi:hypothetical protein
MMAKRNIPSRKLKLRDDYFPCIANEGEEIYPNGIFQFNISRILQHIAKGSLTPEFEEIEVRIRFPVLSGVINETHLPSVDCSQPIILVEQEIKGTMSAEME